MVDTESMSAKSVTAFRLSKRPLAGLMLLILLVVQTLASSADLHLRVHDDAHEAQHECAVQLLSSGQVDLTEGSTVIPAVPVLSHEHVFGHVLVLRQSSQNANSTRGPPSLA